MYLLYLAKKQTCKRKKISAQNLKINHAFCNAEKMRVARLYIPGGTPGTPGTTFSINDLCVPLYVYEEGTQGTLFTTRCPRTVNLYAKPK
jgi:hypothetical protein